MLPPFTNWPPKRLMPRRCPWESRPLTDEPPPFLCAIEKPRSVFARCDYAESARNARVKVPACPSLRQLNIANFNGREVLPVPALNFVLARLLELQHLKLLATAMRDDFTRHLGIGCVGPAYKLLLR